MSDHEANFTHEELSLEEAPIKWLLNTKDLPNQGQRLASEQELRALTNMLNDEHDLEVKSFRCIYEITPTKLAASQSSGLQYVEGCHGHFQFRAELIQTCVVTLERIETLVEEEFSQDFTSKGGSKVKTSSAETQIDDPFAADRPLALVKGKIVLGPLVYQYLSMAIDPNPRKTGISYDDNVAANSAGEDKQPSPFVVLKDFQSKK